MRLQHIALWGVFLAAGLIWAGCDWVSDEESEHAEAYGLEVTQGAETVARVFEAQAAGSLRVTVGAAPTAFRIVFLDRRGARLAEQDMEPEHRLEWTVTGAAEAVRIASDPQQRFGFTVEGRQAGGAALTIRLMHGEHADFTTPAGAVPITAAP